MKYLNQLYHKIFKRKSPVGPLIHIQPLGAPTWHRDEDPTENRIIISEPNPEAYEKLVRVQGEVIEPLPTDTAEDIVSFMSCAACDHEYPRVIVYPIESELRTKVLELLKAKHIVIVDGIETEQTLYPMYEYLSANVVGDDNLNSKTIIYKYRKSHESKSI
jgi:hypothetical protein